MKSLLIALGILASVVGFAMSIDYHPVKINSESNAAAASDADSSKENNLSADTSHFTFPPIKIETGGI